MQSWEYRISQAEYVNMGDRGHVIIRKYEYGDGSPIQYDGKLYLEGIDYESTTELYSTVGQVKQEVAKRIFG